MDKFSYLGNSDIASVEQLYNEYLKNPDNVEKSWADFFKGFDFALQNFRHKIKTENTSGTNIDKEFQVVSLIEAYRQRGHLFTKTNPVRVRRQYFPTLDLHNFNLSDADLNTEFVAGSKIGLGKTSLKNIVNHLENTYCQSVGAEFTYIRSPQVIEWLSKKMEKCSNKQDFPKDTKIEIYKNLVKSVGFEQFVHKKFVGQKRFSLEGAEAVIPALWAAIEKGADLGIEEFVFAMSHRGRLNVLTNVLQKPYENVFSEFSGKEYDSDVLQGDVKYHLGYGNTINTGNGKSVKLNLVPNPSHLEIQTPVVEGIVKSKIVNEYADNDEKIAAVVIHGDAAIAAQGVVYEVVQMAQLPGYKTGGTIHMVINNQVGFTTNYLDARSSTYCTDIAKVTRCPVFHVNGDDIEAVVYVANLAMEFRQTFHTDVFIDVLCYRKYGHNEGDEPRFTQPVLYKAIASHPNPRDIYKKQLIQQAVADENVLKEIETQFDNSLEKSLENAGNIKKLHIKRFLEDKWNKFRYSERKDFRKSVETAVSKEILIELGRKINTLPADRKFFSKIQKLCQDRLAMLENNKLDWAMGELLAYASVINDGFPVRLSGQDCERGTFSHRHAAFVIEDSEEKYFPLKHIAENQPDFHVYNSLLSEYGVLGFEYGYALAQPDGLTIWEAQFGDFHNVAQPIIDQYISSAEEKWGVMNGLVMFLPHGYEGQGPEHSSARIERFLTLAADNNMYVVNCTTPANLFHVLRRQVKTEYRIPLIIFTPKSLLRHPLCVSGLEDFSDTNFKEVIDDNNVDAEAVTRVVYCSGKIYYDLLDRKNKLNARDLAIVRLEQLHPLPKLQLSAIKEKYKNAVLSLWVQEEPENMGAWRYINNELPDMKFVPVCRIATGTTATGLHYIHAITQNEIIEKVFRKCDCELKNNYCGLQCVKGRSREEIIKMHKLLDL